MKLRGYRANGDLLWEEKVVKIEPHAPAPWYTGDAIYYKVHLEDGSTPIQNEACLDKHYPGWRKLLQDDTEVQA